MKELTKTSTMKILIYTLLLSVVMVLGSCEKEHGIIKETPKDKYQYTINTGSGKLNIDTITIEGCQYLVGETAWYQGGPVLCHKGNCTNSLHQQKQQ